jgi:hypothetical protein
MIVKTLKGGIKKQANILILDKIELHNSLKECRKLYSGYVDFVV